MGTYILTGTNINRFTPTKPVIEFNTSTLTAGDPKTQIILDGATCRVYGTHTSSTATAIIKMVGGGTYDGLTVVDTAFQYSNVANETYQTTADRPDYGSHTVRRAYEIVAPTYNAGWGSIASIPVSVTRDLDGWMTFQGAVENGTTSDGTVMFTLPAGYRPSNGSHRFIVPAQTGVATVYVTSAGNVQIFGAVGASFVFLDGIRYKAA
jgi:hypothetical protein